MLQLAEYKNLNWFSHLVLFASPSTFCGGKVLSRRSVILFLQNLFAQSGVKDYDTKLQKAVAAMVTRKIAFRFWALAETEFKIASILCEPLFGIRRMKRRKRH